MKSLLPCPFCGAADNFIADLIEAARAYRAEAECPDMNQHSPAHRKPYDDAARRLDAALAAFIPNYQSPDDWSDDRR